MQHRLRRTRRGPQDTRVRNLIVIGGSAGGHEAVAEILKHLPIDLPAAVIVLLHAPVRSKSLLSRWVAHFTELPVVLATPGQRLRESTVYVAPAGINILVEDGALQLKTLEMRNYMRRSINDLFISAAKAYGESVLAVILSGMCNDGSHGLAAVHQAGGVTMVQNPAGAQFGGMAAYAMSHVDVAFCLNLGDIGPALDLLVRRDEVLETGVAVSVRLLKGRVALLSRLLLQSDQNQSTHAYLAEELSSLKGDLRSVEGLLARSAVACVKGVVGLH